MTRLLGTTLRLPGWVKGLVQDMDAAGVPLGSYSEASNFLPTEAGRLAVRGGSKLINTLHDDAGTPAELTHLCRIAPYSPVGMAIVGWSDGEDTHYLYRMTADGAFFTGTEATSRHDLTATATVSWNNASAPARPLMAELWEKLFLVDATTDYASRNTFLSIASDGTIVQPTFSFDGGAVAVLRPYCVEEYNNVLFIAGYGDATTTDRPEMLRHSFLGRSPDDTTVGAPGFDKGAWEMVGAKGQRITGLKKGQSILLVAKANELYRVSGFGRAYPGWQYQIEPIQNTLGLGVSNPYALTYAEGYWYGLGAQGPFRTDGVVAESLRGPRQRGWALVSNPEAHFVEYHPERRIICFGVRQATGLPSGIYLSAGGTTPSTYPNVLWTWDMERECYAPDQGFGLSLFHVCAVPSTTNTAPQGAPTATDATSVTSTGFTANWTNGDATCPSEYYEKAGASGSYALITTEAAAATSLARTGRTPYTRYFYTLDHIKSGVRSTMSNEIEVKTAMAAPTLAATQGVAGRDVFAPSYLTVTNPSDNVTLYLDESADGSTGWTRRVTVASASAGDHVFSDGADVTSGLYYRAYTEDLAWSPTTSDYSSTVLLPVEA